MLPIHAFIVRISKASGCQRKFVFRHTDFNIPCEKSSLFKAIGNFLRFVQSDCLHNVENLSDIQKFDYERVSCEYFDDLP